jgi:hypothetical protein
MDNESDGPAAPEGRQRSGASRQRRVYEDLRRDINHDPNANCRLVFLRAFRKTKLENREGMIESGNFTLRWTFAIV